MKENEFNQFSEIWRAYANIINPTTAHNDSGYDRTTVFYAMGDLIDHIQIQMGIRS